MPIYPIKPCPWCKKTPYFSMDYNRETWLPKFLCINQSCSVKPISQYVAIRNTSKVSIARLKMKFEQLINDWNETNPCIAYEGMDFDFEEIAREGKK